MKILWNLLAIIGLLFVAGLVYLLIQVGGIPSLDKKAGSVYWQMTKTLLRTGDIAEATVWKVPVTEGLSAEEVEETLKVVANELNIKNVGELPLGQEVTNISGKDYRYLKIFMFCNPMTAAKMVDYSDAFSAYLPCRISLIEDKNGKLWLYSLNMDMMVHGGKTLPPALLEEALSVRSIIQEMMNRAATGEF